MVVEAKSRILVDVYAPELRTAETYGTPTCRKKNSGFTEHLRVRKHTMVLFYALTGRNGGFISKIFIALLAQC